MTWKCTLCDLCIRGDSLPPIGQKYSPVMVLLNTPDYYENKTNATLNSDKGKLILKLFDDIGLTLNNIYVTYISKCYSKDGISTHQLGVCTDTYLKVELTKYKPKIIIVFDRNSLINLGTVLDEKLCLFMTLQYVKNYAVFFIPEVIKYVVEPNLPYPSAKFSLLLKFYKKHINAIHIAK